MIFIELFIKYFKPKPLPLATIEAKLYNETNKAYKSGKTDAFIIFRALDISYMKKNHMLDRLSSRFPVKIIQILGVEDGQKVPNGKEVTLDVKFRYNKHTKDDIHESSTEGGYSSASSISDNDSTSYSSSTWTMSE